MGDWADDIAARVMRDIKRGTADETCLAAAFRDVHADGKIQAMREAVEQTKAAFDKLSMGGGDK